MDNNKALPVVVVRGIVPIPHNEFRIDVGRKISLKAIEEAEKNFDSHILIMVQKNPLIDYPTTSDIEEYGVLAKVAMKIKLSNNTFKVKFNLIDRIKLNSFYMVDLYFVAEYE